MMVKLVRAVTAVRATGTLYVSPMGDRDRGPVVVGVRAHISREDYEDVPKVAAE